MQFPFVRDSIQTLTNIIAGIKSEDKGAAVPSKTLIKHASKVIPFLSNFNLDLLATKLSELTALPIIRYVIKNTKESSQIWEDIFNIIVKANK